MQIGSSSLTGVLGTVYLIGYSGIPGIPGIRYSGDSLLN